VSAALRAGAVVVADDGSGVYRAVRVVEYLPAPIAP